MIVPHLLASTWITSGMMLVFFRQRVRTLDHALDYIVNIFWITHVRLSRIHKYLSKRLLRWSEAWNES